MNLSKTSFFTGSHFPLHEDAILLMNTEDFVSKNRDRTLTDDA
jgi:hypothetical protein